MGFSHSFIATRGVPKAQLLEQLGLAETAMRGDIDIALNGFGLGELRGGWLLVACDDFDFPQKAPLAAISAAGEVVSGAIEEHVMASEARGFAGGAQTWRVTHDPDKGESLFDLQVEGSPPAPFAQIRDKMIAAQTADGGEDAEVDHVFDVPPKLAASLCGFAFGESEGTFVALERARRLQKPKRQAEPGRPRFLARLFGRA